MEPKQAVSEFGKTETTLKSEGRIEKDASMYNPPNYIHQSSDHEENEQSDTKSTDTVKESVEENNSGDSSGELFYNQFNTRALPQTAKTYCLEKFEKNALLILNHIRVEGYDTIRLGSNEDAAALERTFAKFGFEIERHDDLPKVQVIQKLKAFSSRDFTDYGCVAVAVLTHGSDNGLLRATDLGQFYREKDILEHFKTRNKPTLITKPVVLMIQACRGTSNTRAVAVGQSWPIARDHDREKLEPYFLPLECDILVVHSSYAGKSSFRPADGSWFIQTVCKRINQLYKTHDLESIMLDVKREVAIEKYNAIYNTATDDMEVNKQMPVVTSTLIRKLHLYDKCDPHDLVSLSASGVRDGTDGPSSDEIDGPSGDKCEFCKNNSSYSRNRLCENNRYSFQNSWVKLSQSFTVRSIGVCVGICLMYNLLARQK